MYLFYSIVLFGSLYVTVSSQTVKESMCLDTIMNISKNSNKNIHQWIPCESTGQHLISRSTQPNFNEEQDTASAPIQITFNCIHKDKSICGKAERSFERVGRLISDVILFKEPVKVNATFMSFCEIGNECGEHMMTLGGSSPARAMPLMNSDGLLRLHPQALVKQFNLPDHSPFSPFDILSVFNADAPFWFEEDGVPISSHQADFSFVILHEFMHGLGFYSGWNEYVSSNTLTPDPSSFLANQLILLVNPSTNAIHPNQFLESAMDRLLKIIKIDNKPTSIPISEFTKKLNKIQASSLSELIKSPDFEETKEMGKLSTEPGSLGIDLEDETIILETSLKPFQPGSSISHVSYANYTHTPDFLMRFMQDRGLTLEEAVRRGGGERPIGPLLLRIFEEIGYSTTENPDNTPPLLIFQSQGIVNKELKNSTLSGHHGIRRKNQHHHPHKYESLAQSQYQANLYYIILSLCSIIFFFV